MEREIKKLTTLYEDVYGCKPDRIDAIAKAGSGRRYYRMKRQGVCDVIATFGDDRSENKSFIYLSKHFAESGLPVPQIVGVSDDGHFYLQTDVGHRSLYDVLMECGVDSAEGVELLKRTVEMLAQFRCNGSAGLDYSQCLDAAMDRSAILSDLQYFRYCFLKTVGAERNVKRLNDEFEMFADEMAAAATDGVMLRDFQSRNVMVADDGSLSVIDFQGARRGPAAYDLVSLLWQSRLKLPESLRRQLVEHYIATAPEIEDADEFRQSIARCVLLRTLQTLGAYGFRGLVERKELFVKSIPEALRTLQTLPDSAWRSMPLLRTLIGHIAAMPRFSAGQSSGRLRVTVMSFAYKMGLPVDESGNGGGYVFDCRALHNPGRYDRYKPLTGRDEPVVEFMESNGDVESFLEAAFSMVDGSVEVYLRRGFTSLSVAFGCTGGRHRSVYCAERMASHLAEKFAGKEIDTVLIHREQNIIEKR